LHAAHLAKALGTPRISAIEFGVAGGNGLLALEAAAQAIEPRLDVGIDVYGFDSGSGLPDVQDPRDLPNLFSQGDYRMDPAALTARLTRAQLILGWVNETVPTFLASAPAPVGFISFDLDLYGSTRDALQLLAGPNGGLLPRVHCYFDDIIGFTYGDCNGERLAIGEFNRDHESRKISRIYGLRYFVPEHCRDAPWTEQIYLAHVLDHPDYGSPDGLNTARQFDLSAFEV
jgi:hypothetical protein